MLTIYYKYSEAKVIGQYEFENFMMMYHAYKSLWGNSFIDKVCDDIKDWEIINPNGKKVEDPTTIPYYPRKKKKGR